MGMIMSIGTAYYERESESQLRFAVRNEIRFRGTENQIVCSTDTRQTASIHSSPVLYGSQPELFGSFLGVWGW